MLQRIRDRISGWIAGVVIALVAGAFMLFGVEYYFDQGAADQTEMAKVNGVVITDAQVSNAFSELQRQTQAQMQGKPLSNEMTEQLKAYALQSLVTQTALFTTLQNEGFRIGMMQVKTMIEQTPEFQSQGQFSEAKMMAALYQANLTPLAFFQRVQTQWLVSQVTNSIAASAFSLPNEVKHWYGLKNQQRAFGYFIIPMQSFVSKVSVSDADIKNYYTENKAQFETPAKVSVSYIVLSPADLAKNITVTQDEAKSYYESHLSNYQVPKRWVVSQITIPLAATATTTEVTTAEKKAVSVSNAFAHNKETGYTSTTITLSSSEIDAGLQSTLSALTVGAVSKPLRTPNGYTVLKLIKILPAQTRSFASVESNLIKLMQHQRVNETLTKESNALADLTYTNPDSLAVAAKTLNLPIQTSPLITKAGEKTGIFANPKVLAAVFSDSVFKSNNNSTPIDLGNGSLVVVRIDKKEASQPIPLETVRAQIKLKLSQKQAEAQAGLLAYQVQKKIEAGVNPTTVATENNLQWHVVPLTTEDAKSSVPHNIIAAAFKTVQYKTVLFNQHDYAVIAVNQVKNADAKNMSVAVNQQLNQQLSVLWGQLMQHCFVNSVITKAHIIVKPQS